MLNWMRLKKSFKLLIAALLSFILLIIFILYGAKWLTAELENLYTSKNETYMKKQADTFLSRLTYEQMMRDESIFQKIALSSSLISKQAGFFLDHMDTYGKTPFNSNEKLTVYPPNGIFSNDSFETTMVMYWGASAISPKIRKKLNAVSHTDPLIMEVQKKNPEVVSAYIVTESGFGRYYPNDHAVESLLSPKEYDMRNANSYNISRPENNAARKTVWTNIHRNDAGHGLVITATTPIYSNAGRYIGAACVDVTLNTLLNNILDHKKLTPSLAKRGRVLTNNFFSFLVDDTGKLIAFPLEYLEKFGLEPDMDKLENAGVVLEYGLSDSSDPRVREIGQRMIKKDHDVISLSLNGTSYVILFHSMASTGWRMGVVIPESAALASVGKILDTMNSETKK